MSNPVLVNTFRGRIVECRHRGSVAVCDTQGRVVRTLVDGTLPAGEQVIAWDGRDAQGRMVASGIYYYELRTAAEHARGKLTRIR